MSVVTGTYNSISLGDAIWEVDKEAKISAQMQWGTQITPLFEEQGVSCRHQGTGVKTITVAFIKEPSGANYATPLKRLEYFRDLDDSLRCAIGTTGSSLVLTDGTTTSTWTTMFLRSLSIVSNKVNGIVIQAQFVGATE